MIQLKLIEPNWINGDLDDPQDQCAHGKILFSVDGLEIVSGGEEWTVSAAALFLLRSVTDEHTEIHSVSEANFLIPCCAFNPFKCEGEYGLLLMGCNSGIDPQIHHENGMIKISFKGEFRTVRQNQWASAVVGFCDQVLEFYSSSSPKAEVSDKNDKDGWSQFWREVFERRERVRYIAQNT